MAEVEKHTSTTTFKLITVSCTTFFLYYIILHFDEEVEYIWTRRWTSGKVAYLLTRYLGSVFLILATLGTAHIKWNEHGFPIFDAHGIKAFLIDSCFTGHLYTGLGTMVILLAEIILMMRVYALFGGGRGKLLSFTILTLLLFGFNILQVTIALDEVDVGARPFVHQSLGNFGCVDGHPMSGIAWTMTSSVELLLFLLVLWKTMQLKELSLPTRISMPRDGPMKTQSITALMARDSIVYFAVIFSVCFLGALLTFLYEHSNRVNSFTKFLDFIGCNANAYQTIVVTIMTILAPKMLINLRAEHYGPVGIIATELSWDFRV